jgi:F-type H+-transporting ATPase subunit b
MRHGVVVRPFGFDGWLAMYRLILRLFAVLFVCVALHASVAPATANEAHPEGAAAAHEEGLPMDWKRDLALFSLITFVVYVFVLRAGAWGPLRAGLSERERGIRQDLADAESNRLKSEAMLKEHELRLAKVQDEVREILAEARRDAEHTKQEIVTTAQREAETTRTHAIADIERSRDQALTELFEFVSNNVINATEQVIGRSLTGADQDRLVNDALAQLNVRRN